MPDFKKLYEKYIEELKKPAEIAQFKSDSSKLTKVDTRNNSWRKNLDRYMKTHDFQRLGSGKYASVYGNNRYDYVVKVFQRDAAYMRWLNFSLRNKNNPYVPKIKGSLVKVTPMIYAVRLEKLRPGRITGQFAIDYVEWLHDPNYKSEDPDLQVLLDFFEENRKLMDLHDDNVMFRGSQIVVVDPFYNWFGKYEPGRYTIDPNE